MTDGGGMMDFITSPLFWGFLGIAAVAGGGLYLWNKNQKGNTKGFMELFGYNKNLVSKKATFVGAGINGQLGAKGNSSQ